MAETTKNGIQTNGSHNPVNMLDDVDNLRGVGFEQKQAEAVVRVQYRLVESNLATKKDIEDTHLKIEHIRSELKRDIEAMGYKLTIRMGILYGGSIGVVLGCILTMAKLGWLSIN